MPGAVFQPGFRISVVDRLVIVVGAAAAIALWSIAWWLGFIVAYVVMHFFLFCNIFRVARAPELVWSGLFIGLTYGTLTFGVPSWAITIGVSLAATALIVALEMRKPSYHGVLWQRINPGLPQWWAKRSAAKTEAHE
ncbi:MAG: hypothetical protein K8U03_27015 [Planctomycetia bacterium]|nr:hypothetical protein [Planctomycetia bacterium]